MPSGNSRRKLAKILAKIKKIATEGFIIENVSDGCDKQYIKSLPTFGCRKMVKSKMAARKKWKTAISPELSTILINIKNKICSSQ